MNNHKVNLRTIVLMALCMCVMMAENSFADAFLKIDGIEGESTDKDHDKWIIIQGFSHQFENSVIDGTGRRGGATLSVIAVSKKLDKSSPKIAEGVLTGKNYPIVKLELTRIIEDIEIVYLSYELKNVRISSYSFSDTNQGAEPKDDFSLNYEEIKVTYTELDDDGNKKGNVEYSWKVEEGES